jgi:predicted ATP-grasp superfamily ATP-dependent carboligase
VKRPVLILGWIPRVVMSVARSLHAYRIPVDVASFQTAAPIRSRVIGEFVKLARPDLFPAEFVEQLCLFIRQRGHDMLIPADDQSLIAIGKHYEVLKDMLYVACPPPQILQLVLNKASTLEIAQACGMRVPKSVLVHDSAHLHDMVDVIPFPWILKPAEKEQQEEEFKSCKFATADEVRKRFPISRRFDPNMLLQEYCPGVGVGVETLVHNGECLAVFQHRRLKEWPYTGGVAVTAIAESPNPTLVQSSLTLLRALQWEGVAMVEFRVNLADGQAVLMEVNGRYWGTISLPILSGLNFPLYHWRQVHGEPIDAPGVYAIGTKWRWTAGYFYRMHNLAALAPHSAVARRALFDSLRHFARDFSPSVRDAMFNFSDPMPAITELHSATKYFSGHVWKAFLRHYAAASHAL